MSTTEPTTERAAAWETDIPSVGESPDECNFTLSDKAPFTTQSEYWREYLRTCKIVASRPNGTYLNEVVADLHGQNEVSSGETEYQRTRRFLNRNPEFFRVRKADGLVFVRPTLPLLDLINGGIIQNTQETASTGDSQFCEKVLKSVKEINEKGQNLLEFNLKEYVDRINDLRLVLHSEEADPEYISLPYKTRFNDSGRIDKQFSIMSSCIEKAGEEFDNAALLTLTTDPKKFNSLYEMVDNINKSWNRLMSWLSTDSRLGYRPEYVKVLEFTEKGYPHLHAIVFLEDHSTLGNGMPWLDSKDAISRYWDQYQGRIVDVQPLTWEDDLGEQYGANAGWVRWQEDGNHGGDLGESNPDPDSSLTQKSRGGQTAGEYLGKYLSAIYGGIRGMNSEDVATEDPTGEVTEKYEDKASTWKVAMYWATGRKIRTESRGLRQAVEDDKEDEDEDDEKGELAEIIREQDYNFVGAYQSQQIPAYIRRELAAVDALMEAIDTPDNEGKVIGNVPDRARPLLLADELEGSGMLFDTDDEEELAEAVEGGESEGPSAADFM